MYCKCCGYRYKFSELATNITVCPQCGTEVSEYTIDDSPPYPPRHISMWPKYQQEGWFLCRNCWTPLEGAETKGWTSCPHCGTATGLEPRGTTDNIPNPDGSAPDNPETGINGGEVDRGSRDNTYAGDAVPPLARHHNQNNVENLDRDPHDIDKNSKLQSKLEVTVGDTWKPDEESSACTETNDQERPENDSEGLMYKPPSKGTFVVIGCIIAVIIVSTLFLTGVIGSDKSASTHTYEEEVDSLTTQKYIRGSVSSRPTLGAEPSSTYLQTPILAVQPTTSEDEQLHSQTPSVTPTLIPSIPRMYSSYAHLVSLDQSAGIAEFDYFDMLKGADAVSWLVEMEGYSESAAEKIVAGYSDNEFIEKNTNPSLRSVELGLIPIILANGSLASGPEKEIVDYKEFLAQYLKNPPYFLNECFYYIEVDEATGDVKLVTQIYWP